MNFNFNAIDSVLVGAGTYLGSPTLELDLIDPDADNPRSDEAFELDESWPSFVDSIRMNGILEPLFLTPPNPSGRHTIIRGHRRRRGAVEAGLVLVPVRYAQTDAEREKPLALYLDNKHRTELHPVDEARYLSRQMNLHQWDQAELARRASLSPAYVSQRLALLRMPDDLLQEMSRRPKFSVTAAVNLARHFERDEPGVRGFIKSCQELTLDSVDKFVAAAKPAPSRTVVAGQSQEGKSCFAAAKKIVTKLIDVEIATDRHEPTLAQELKRLKKILNALKA